MKILDFFFDTAKGKMVAAIAGMLALFTWFTMEQQKVGARNAVGEINQKAAAQVKEARKARERVPAGGNVEWLRKNACRDC